MKSARERLETLFVAMTMAEGRDFSLGYDTIGHGLAGLRHAFADVALAEEGALPAAPAALADNRATVQCPAKPAWPTARGVRRERVRAW